MIEKACFSGDFERQREKAIVYYEPIVASGLNFGNMAIDIGSAGEPPSIET
jgi:hypothetical protein